MWGLAAALVPALVCFGLLVAIVAIANSRPQQGPVTCGASRLWVPTGETVILNIAGAPATRAASAVTPVPLDVILVVDQSGSMTQFSGILPEGVRRATAVLARPDNANRFALVYFSDAHQVVQPWTHDRALIVDSARLPLAGGGTRSAQIIAAVDELLADNPSTPARHPVVIVFSDTEFPEPQAVEAGAARLRQSGVQFYVVLTPNEPDHSQAERITGSAEHVIVLNDENELAERLTKTFALLLSNASNTVRADAWIHQSVFDLASQHPLAQDWRRESAEQLSATAISSDAGVAFELPLQARRLGLWQVGERAVELTSVGARGAPAVAACSYRPMVLVAPLWLWLLALLPAVLWILQALQYWLRKPVPYSLQPPAVAMVEPVVRSLPLPPPGTRHEASLIPTLIVGVGERARTTLAAVRLDLMDSVSKLPVRIVSIATRSPVASAAVDDIETFVIPRELATTGRYLPDPNQVASPHLPWFDSNALRDASTDRLDVSGAGANDRGLNRYALLHWLEKGLGEALRAIGNEFAAKDTGAGQVILVADVDEAFASACSIDIANVLRSATSRRPIDVSVILLTGGDARNVPNRLTFMQELETRTCIEAQRSLGAGGVDARPPVDHVFVVAGSARSSEREASDAIVMLLRRDVAQFLYIDARAAREALASRGQSGICAPMRLCAAKVGFRASDLAEAVAYELLQRWIVGSVLGRTEASAQGGYQLDPARASGQAIVSEFLAGTRGRLADLARILLLAIEDHGDVSELAAAIARAGSQRAELLLRAVTQVLDEIVTSVGRSGFGMGDAFAAMTALGDGLASGEFAKRFAAAGGAGADLQWLQRTVVPMIVAFREKLRSTWVAAALERTSQVRELQERLLARDFSVIERGLGRKVNRNFIAMLADDSNARLTSGQGGADAADWVTLRARLDADKLIAEGRIAIGQYFSSYVPEPFFDVLTARAEAAISALHQYTLSWLLRRHPSSAQALAEDLKLEPGQGGRAIVIRPEASSTIDAAAIAQLVGEVPPLVGTAKPAVVLDGSDPRWVRRIAFAAEAANDINRQTASFEWVTAADHAAERARGQLESLHQVRVPVFPPQIRAAFSDTEAINRFARLRATGSIVRKIDEFGRQQWSLASVPLTSGNHPTLADALASYVLRGMQEDAPVSSAGAAGENRVDRDAIADGHNPDALTGAILSAALQGHL